jgi:hypothetical protein
VIKKEAEKTVKYKHLIREIRRMRIVKAEAIQVIIGTTGTISKSLTQYLNKILIKQEIKEMQKNIHIGHCTNTTENANVKVQNIFHGRNFKYRRAATPYTPETWLFQVYNCKYPAYR